MERKKKSKRGIVTEATSKRITEIGAILDQKDEPRHSIYFSPVSPLSDDEKKAKLDAILKEAKEKAPSPRPEPLSSTSSFRKRSSASSESSPPSTHSAAELGGQSGESIPTQDAYSRDEDQEIEEVRHEMTRSEMEIATGILEKHIAALEEDRVKDDAKRREERKRTEEIERKEREIEALWNQTFVPVGKQMQMLKTSMRFVPGINTTPNVIGGPEDPPYLFKVPGRPVDRKRKADYTVLGNVKPTASPPPGAAFPPGNTANRASDGTTLKTPSGAAPSKSKFPRPAFGLNWPNQGSQLVYRSHHNLLVAFLAYYNRKAEAESAGFSGTDLYDPSLSISCSLACGKSPYPPREKKLAKMPVPVDSSAMYTPVPLSTTAVETDWKSVAAGLQFWPTGFGPQPDGTFVPLPLEYYMPQNQPYFPDPTEFKDIPPGSTVGYMDNAGNFYVPDPGDPLPPDAAIGYLDDEGVYHHVLDMLDGMASAKIPFRQVYPYYPSDDDDEVVDPYGAVHEPKVPKQVPYNLIGGQLQPGTFNKAGEFGGNIPGKASFGVKAGPPGYQAPLPSAKPHPHRAFVSEEEYLPGDVSHHQSEAVFASQSQAIVAQKNIWVDVEKKKKKKRKKDRKKATYFHENQEEGETETEDEDEDEVGSDGSPDESDEDEYAGEWEGEDEEGYASEAGEGDEGDDERLRLPPGPPVRFDTSIATDPELAKQFHGLTKEEIVANLAPHGSRAGYLDEFGQFVPVEEDESFPEGVPPGYMDERGVFHQLLMPGMIGAKGGKESVAPDVPEGFVDAEGVFHSMEGGEDASGSSFGFIGEDGVFQALRAGARVPSGATAGHLDKDGMFHVAKALPVGALVGFLDEFGNFQALLPGEEMPADVEAGYMDNDGTFHKAPPKPPAPRTGELRDGRRIRRDSKGIIERDDQGRVMYEGGRGSGEWQDDGTEGAARGGGRGARKGQGQARGGKRPSAEAKPETYTEDANELIEVEIRDENDLDEKGNPKVKVILRHRGSIAAPADAREIEGGGKVWMDGDEEVTEMPYLDHNDLDEEGKPKLKRMRVRKRVGQDTVKTGRGERGRGPRPGRRVPPGADGRRGRGHSGQPGETDDDDEDWEDLRSQPMTAAERERLLEFQRNVAVQVELDYIEGSLDLGEVIRKSFRLYSHGGSIDIDPAAVVRRISMQMQTDTSRASIRRRLNGSGGAESIRGESSGSSGQGRG